LADLPLEATVALADVAGAIKDGLLALASATGFVVMHQMMQAELAEVIGEKHAKIGSAERSGNWHGTTKGSVVLGGRRVRTERPRGRTTAGAEIELDTWKAFSSADLLAPIGTAVTLQRLRWIRRGDLSGLGTSSMGATMRPTGAVHQAIDTFFSEPLAPLVAGGPRNAHLRRHMGHRPSLFDVQTQRQSSNWGESSVRVH
jgi:hypothetical protein